MKKYLYEDLYRFEDTHWWHISKRKIVFNLIKEYRTNKDPKILDVGCGSGRNLKEFQRLGTVHGIDKSPLAINYCRKTGLNKLKVGLAEQTDFKANYFDIITLLDVLEHTDDGLVLKEMKRILKNNGLIIATVPAFKFLWSRWDEVLRHKRRYNPKSLRKLFSSNGFTIIKMTYLYSFLVIPAMIARKIKEKIYRKQYPSDFELTNTFFNAVLGNLSRIELFVSKFVPIPIGTTILIVARKNIL